MSDIKKLLLFILTFILSNPESYGQIKSDIWFFGDRASLVYRNDSVFSNNALNGVHFDEGNGQLNDSDGNIILFSDYDNIYDKFGNVVVSGLGGFSSSTQSSIILRHPENDSFIYVFTNDVFDIGEGLSFTQLVKRGNSFIVLMKNKTLINRGTEKLNAINHQNGRDIWVTSHSFGDNNFHNFLITKNGLIQCPVISGSGNIMGNTNSWFGAQGQLKFSPNGEYCSVCFGDYIYDDFQVFHFDNQNAKFKLFISSTKIIPYGTEFSSVGNSIYVSDFKGKNIYQYSLSSKDSLTVINSERLIATSSKDIFQQMQLGIDGRIYVAIKDSFYLGAIESPEDTGINCNFNRRSIYLGQANKSLGLPNFNQSRFYKPAIDYKYELNCIFNKMQFWGNDTFKATNHNWHILKNNVLEASYSSKSPFHNFKDTGSYTVRYIATNGSRNDTVSKSITIYSKINKYFLGKDTVYSQGTSFNKTLTTPVNLHCIRWQNGSGLSTFTADTAGVYVCKVTNKSFCEVTDTIVITECINSLTTPSLYRSRDTLYTYQPVADSFVWFRNNVQYRITKEPFIRLIDTGIYRVEAARNGYCNKSSSTNHVNKLGISSFQLSDFNIQLFPNPSTEQVFIKADKNFILQISDVTGRIISIQENIETIYLPKGIYFFNFMVDEYRFTEKVIIL